MPTETELVALRGRVARHEAQIELLYQHLGLTFGDGQSLAHDSS
jgi:hypothetical protein